MSYIAIWTDVQPRAVPVAIDNNAKMETLRLTGAAVQAARKRSPFLQDTSGDVSIPFNHAAFSKWRAVADGQACSLDDAVVVLQVRFPPDDKADNVPPKSSICKGLVEHFRGVYMGTALTALCHLSSLTRPAALYVRVWVFLPSLALLVIPRCLITCSCDCNSLSVPGLCHFLRATRTLDASMIRPAA